MTEQSSLHSGIIDLNDIMQAALQRWGHQQKRSLRAVRCSELPCITGPASVWEEVLGKLLALVAEQAPAGKQLFLRVECNRVEEWDEGTKAKTVFHQLQFYTPLRSADLPLAGQAELEACRQIFEQLQVRFHFHPITHTGCLYVITIPAEQ